MESMRVVVIGTSGVGLQPRTLLAFEPRALGHRFAWSLHRNMRRWDRRPGAARRGKLVDALDAYPDDPSAQALAMDDAVTAHIAPCYADQAAGDAALLHSVRSVPAHDPPPAGCD